MAEPLDGRWDILDENSGGERVEIHERDTKEEA